MKKFWKWRNVTVKNESGGENSVRELRIDGAIADESWFDDDVTPELFRAELNSGSGDVILWINSPGGDCFAAAQIYTMIAEYKGKVTVKIDGIAASAASVIAMAGDVVLMSPVANMMIHNPATIACGDQREMRHRADVLDEIKESIINAYERKTGLSRTRLAKLMDEETWLSAYKAVELGFADEIIGDNSSDENDADAPVKNVTMFSQRITDRAIVNRLCGEQSEENTKNARTCKEALSRLELIEKMI